MPPADRAKLPPNLRNLPLHRLSSGALMLLNRDNNLVLPPRIDHDCERRNHGRGGGECAGRLGFAHWPKHSAGQ